MATGEIIQARTNADGWQLIPEIEGLSTSATYNLGSGAGVALATDADWSAVAAVQLYVESPGYTITGASTTVGRTIYGTKMVRKPYPDEATLDEVVNANTRLECKVALDDYLYDGETGVVATVAAAFAAQGGNDSLEYSGGAVTNSSTLTYPRVIMRSITVPYQRVTGTWDVEFVCDHLYARAGKPVACVKVTASDTDDGGAYTETVTATYVRKQFAGSGLYCGVYRATFDAADFGQGKKIKVTAKAFPWVGDSTACIDSATAEAGIVGDGTAPSELLSPLWFFCDKDNALALYASVDGVGGGSPAVASTAAAARLAPYDTLANALTALKADNSRGFATLDACYVLMQDGNYTGPGTFTGSNARCWCTVMADIANGATQAGVVFNSAANAAHNVWQHFVDVTFTASNAGLFRGHANGLLWLDSCTIDHSSTSTVYTWGACYATDNTIINMSSAGLTHSGTYRNPWVVVAGNVCSEQISAHHYCIVGNKRVRPSPLVDGNAAGYAVSDNAICCNNEDTYAASSWADGVIGYSLTIAHGISISGNVLAKITDNSSALLQVAADNSALAVRQALVRLNSLAGGTSSGGGGRANLFYNDTADQAPARILCDCSFCAFSNVNNKSDTFTTANGTRVGNWPAVFGVRMRGVAAQSALFDFEYDGRNSNMAAAFDWADDNSLTGSNDGGGNYATTGDTASRIPSGEAPAGWDLYGNEISDTGTGYAGAVQPPVPPTIGVVLGGQRGSVSADGLTITVPLSEAGCTPASGTLGFTVGGTAETVTGWAIGGSTLTITMSGAIESTDTITLSYDSGDGEIVDEVGNALATFSDYAIRNDSEVSSAQSSAIPLRGRARGLQLRSLWR